MRLWRKLAAILVVYWARALEYRIVILIWILATTVPLVMMGVWMQLASTGDIGGYSRGDFIAYYMANLLLLHLVSTWHGPELSRHIRQGELNPLLLKPFHPLWIYALRPLPTKPLRLPIFLPPIILVAWLVPGVHYDLRPITWLALGIAMAVAYAITFLAQTALALLAFWMAQAEPLIVLWFHLRMLFSGYLVPIALFPESVTRLLFWLPFRYTLSLPLEIITGKLPQGEWLPALGMGLAWVAFFYGVTWLLWRAGVRAYTAVGA